MTANGSQRPCRMTVPPAARPGPTAACANDFSAVAHPPPAVVAAASLHGRVSTRAANL
jgi:hypothetical protein